MASDRALGLFLALLLLGLAGCQPSRAGLFSTADPAAWNVAPTASETAALETPYRSATPSAVVEMDFATATISVVSSTSTPLPDPLRFTFPIAQAMPVSAWRPPLYPTPWALSPYDHFYFVRPIAADQVNLPLQNYRYGGEFFQDVVHTGVDIPASEGTPVLAAGSGKVVWAGYGVYRGGNDPTDPYGLAVTIRHDFGYKGQALYTVYGHLSQVDVAVGQIVQTGEKIGLVGQTGRVTGPHLHFEVRIGENDFFATRNPELWVVPPVGWGVLAGQILDSNGNRVEAQPVVLTSLATGQNWFTRSYGAASPVNSDPYYQENVAIGDLPAGRYLIRIAYAGVAFSQEVEILPGVVNYFYFYGKRGIVVAAPPTPVPFSPEETATP